MFLSRLAVLLFVVLFAAGCKDSKNEMVCDKETGRCSPKISNQEIVEVQEPLFQRIPTISELDEPINQEFNPIHESQIMNQDIMTLAGNEGEYNDVDMNDVDIPGLGHAEAAINGDADYVRKNFKENLWPGGVEQRAELDLGEF